MSKLQIVDMLIILFGVSMAWVCAWKAHHHYQLENHMRSAFYITLVIALLIVVFVEALRGHP